MNRIRSWLGSLPRGTRLLLLTGASLCLLDSLGQWLGHAWVSGWLGLDPTAVRGGAVWRVLTYWLVPGGLLDLAVSCLMVLLLAPRLERDWSATEIWSYCAIAGIGTGLCHLLLGPQMLLGMSGVIFGLLAAWIKLYGSELLQLPGLGPVRTRVLIFGAMVIGFAMTSAVPGGWRVALVQLGGAITGWIYLIGRWRWNRSRPGAIASSARMRRIEL